MIAGTVVEDGPATVADGSCGAAGPGERPSAFADLSAIVTSPSAAAEDDGCALAVRADGTVGLSRHIGHVSRPSESSTPGSLRSLRGEGAGVGFDCVSAAAAICGRASTCAGTTGSTDVHMAGGAERSDATE